MKLIQQRQKLQIIPTVHEEESGCSTWQKHGRLLPKSIRGAICGPSGCGKTCVMVNLLYHPDALRFANIYLFCKTLDQPKYKELQALVNSNPGMSCIASSDAMIPLSDVKENSILIFDDVGTESQIPIRNAYCTGRHRGIDCFYLTQTYTSIPKHLLRDNFNLIVLFKQDLTNMRHVFEDHIAGDMNFNTFQKMCAKAWDTAYSFLVIAKDDPLNKGRYRRNFDQFFEDINS